MGGKLWGFKKHFQLHFKPRNNTNYWTFIPQGKKTFKLPRKNNKFMYDMIETFMGTQAMFFHPHIQNLMSINEYLHLKGATKSSNKSHAKNLRSCFN